MNGSNWVQDGIVYPVEMTASPSEAISISQPLPTVGVISESSILQPTETIVDANSPSSNTGTFASESIAPVQTPDETITVGPIGEDAIAPPAFESIEPIAPSESNSAEPAPIEEPVLN